MKKFLLPIACINLAFSQIANLPATEENIAKFEQIIDVRTPEEWQQTGVIKGAKTIELINDKEEFLRRVKEQINTSKPFALICRSGNRSNFAAKLIDDETLKITNLDGGMKMLLREGYKTEPYNK